MEEKGLNGKGMMIVGDFFDALYNHANQQQKAFLIQSLMAKFRESLTDKQKLQIQEYMDNHFLKGVK